MKIIQIIEIIIILVVTGITTCLSWNFFCELFFFFGFFNPVIFIGTGPLLLLGFCLRENKKDYIKYVKWTWLLISIFLVIVASIIMFNTGY